MLFRSTLKDRILGLLQAQDGLTDREITDRLLGSGAPQQPVNQTCRQLQSQNRISRRPRLADGKIGNYMTGLSTAEPAEQVEPHSSDDLLSEDSVKRHVQAWLEADGWRVTVVLGKGRGIDIEAFKQDQRWVIEAKGIGSSNPMRVNYFLSMLGETLQRMNDPMAQYSIALPDHRQFRNLWARLPELAKSRTGITVLFVDANSNVDHLDGK